MDETHHIVFVVPVWLCWAIIATSAVNATFAGLSLYLRTRSPSSPDVEEVFK